MIGKNCKGTLLYTLLCCYGLHNRDIIVAKASAHAPMRVALAYNKYSVFYHSKHNHGYL
jgi:hypothetical protein